MFCLCIACYRKFKGKNYGKKKTLQSAILKGELIEREDFAEDLAAFKFRLDKQLPFIPGQYATIGLSSW